MSTRHLARSVVLQALFAWDMQGRKEGVLEEQVKFSQAEFGVGLEDDPFAGELAEGIARKQQILDDVIAKAAPEWPIDKISGVDRNALRIGLYELLFGDRTQVPPKVALNEAIELAKTFGGENSGRFVNGVLGTIYKELGEPGKDDISKKKKAQEPVDPATLPVEYKAAAVVFSVDENMALRFAMVHDVFGYWTLAKGSIAADEDESAGAAREVQKEIGVPVEILEKLGENEYIANHPENGKIRKSVRYFLAKGPFQELELDRGTGGLDDARWFEASEVSDLRMYADVTDIIRNAVERIVASHLKTNQ